MAKLRVSSSPAPAIAPMPRSLPGTHSAAVRAATEAYATDLKMALNSIRAQGQSGVLSLVRSLEASLAKGPRLTADDVPFGVDVLAEADLSQHESGLLRNQFTLGSGASDAPVIAMGTEEGYDPAGKGLDLALWNCTNGLLWLSGSPLPVVRRLARGIPEAARRAGVDLDKAASLRTWAKAESVTDDRWPCHRYPVRWAQLLGPVRGGRSTWGILAEILRVSLEELDDHCYQIERSVAPASKASGGSPPEEKRVKFLCTLLGAMRSTGRVLLIHGKVPWRGQPVSPQNLWGRADFRLTAAFLGTENLGDGDEMRIGRQRIRIFRNAGRAALWIWAPGARPSSRYIGEVSNLISEVLSKTHA